MHHLTPFKPVSEQNPYPPQHKLPILSTKPLSSAQNPYHLHKTPILSTNPNPQPKTLSSAQNPLSSAQNPYPQHKIPIISTKPLSSAQNPLSSYALLITRPCWMLIAFLYSALLLPTLNSNFYGALHFTLNSD